MADARSTMRSTIRPRGPATRTVLVDGALDALEIAVEEGSELVNGFLNCPEIVPFLVRVPA